MIDLSNGALRDCDRLINSLVASSTLREMPSSMLLKVVQLMIVWDLGTRTIGAGNESGKSSFGCGTYRPAIGNRSRSEGLFDVIRQLQNHRVARGDSKRF